MKKQDTKFSRRDFLAAGAAAAAFTIVPRRVLGGQGYVPPSETIHIAVIGCGGQGRTNIRQLMQYDDVRIVAVADPNESEDYSKYYYGGMAGRLPVKQEIEQHYRKQDPSFVCNDYKDFRDLFDQEKHIDAILCATPDHWHAFISMAAIKRGKHIYCEKPLTHNIHEARMIVQAAKEAKVATQMGNHGHSGEGNKMMCEWLWAGAVGQVREVHAWSNSGSCIGHKGLPEGTPPVPKGLDWKLWLGPRPMRPYHPEYAPYRWRAWWQFGTGVVGDLCLHHFDPAYTALKVGHPTWVEGSGQWIDDEVSPPNNRVEWFFEKTDHHPELRFIWTDGSHKPPRPEELEQGRRIPDNGVLVIGDKGKIMAGGWSGIPRLIPESKMKAYDFPPKTLRRSPGHHREWLDAIKGGPQPSSHFEFGGLFTEFALLGNLATRTTGRINWNAQQMKVEGKPELDPVIHGQYRPEWALSNI